MGGRPRFDGYIFRRSLVQEGKDGGTDEMTAYRPNP
jgi:hypothetical protein